MRNLIGWTAAVAAMTLALPAAAAEPASLRCVADELGNDFALAQVDRISSALIGGEEDIPKLPDAPVTNAVKTCGDRNGWSADARDMARMLTSIAILRGAIEKVLRADGLDVGQIKRIYGELPDSTRRAFINPDDMKDASLVAARKLIAEKIDLSGKHGEHIGMYFGALAGAEFVTPMFAKA